MPSMTSSLQQASITELTETMLIVSNVRINDQQQSFKPLVSSTVDQFFGDHHPVTVQVLFFIVSEVRCF